MSQFAVVYCLMKQAKALGAFKIAKQAVTLLQNLKIPAQFQESVDVSITVPHSFTTTRLNLAEDGVGIQIDRIGSTHCYVDLTD